MAGTTIGFAASLAVFLAICSLADSACKQNDIRLQNGPTPRQGRVEICRNNQWGTVCDDLWGTNDAKVVCNQLNYDANYAIARTQAYFGKGTGKPIWLDNVRCGSGEYKLINCPKNCIGCHNCNHNEDAGAECPPCLDGNVWVPGGNTWREGTVEVCYNGIWSTVCDDQFGLPEAQVVCAQMGYDPAGAQQFTGAYFGQRYGPIVLDNLACTGTEQNLFQCEGNTIGVHNCDHSEDAGVRCPVCPKGSIRLWSAKNDTPASEGMLHYCHNSGEWKAMCRYSWNCVDAKVACRDLGFNGSLSVKALVDVDGAYGFYLPVLPQRVGCSGAETVLKNCNFYYTTWCNHALYETAGVRCTEAIVGHGCTNGDLRLVEGRTSDEGRIEYCFHSEWSPFCLMHDEEVSVACKQLGYTDYTIGSLFKDERFGSAGYVSDFDSITCSETASENHMSECDVKYSSGCTINSCATEHGIKCFNPGMCKDGEVRLVDGNIEQEGRAEACLFGVWSTICDWGWNALDAYIMCRNLGYDSSKSPDLLLDSYFGDGYFPVAMSNLACGGWEKNLIDCPRKDYLQFYTCGRHTLASVRCYEDCTEGEVRLVGGAYENEGTVEICSGGLWGLIADAGWDDNDAKVICRQAGFPNNNGAVSLMGSAFGRPNKTVHYSNVHCTGAEDTIDDCTKQVIPLSDGRTAFLNASVVGVDCIYEPPTHPPCIDVNITALPTDGCTEDDVRLVGGDGDNDEGRVEYCIDSRWSPFCIMDEITASVICKTLGFTQYTWAKISINTSYGVEKNYSHFDNITCSDTSIADISQCSLYSGDCIPYCPNKNIALRCFTPGVCTEEGAVRLIDGFVDNEGRVEVCINGVWGGICDDGWDATDAHVVCQQLGHPELVPLAYHNSFFGDGLFPIAYSMMDCGGYEKLIGDCDKKVYSEFTCSRENLAGVLCGQDCQNGDLRLQGGPSVSEGTVEICIDNVWGNIVETGFGDKDASVVCKLLGFFSDGAVAKLGSLYGKTGASAHVTDLVCNGEENSILDCSLTIWSLSEGKDLLSDADTQVAGVFCVTEDTCIPPPPLNNLCTPGDIQIDSPDSSSMGNLRYCANGTWSSFCSLSGGAAAVACKSLGFDDYTWAGIIDDGRYNPTSNMSLFQNFSCSGEESSLADCVANADCISRCTTPYGIQCYNPNQCTQESIRLANGDIAQEGRLEVCIDNVWGAVCGVDWNKIDALVVCRELGLGVGEPIIYTDATNFGETPGPILYSKVACLGWEDKFLDCPKNSYFDVSCPRQSMAGVVCRDVCEDGDIKLMNGPGDNEGTVVICKDSFWGLIGQTTWDDRDAQVVCRQLGYAAEGASARLNSYYGKPNITLQSSSVVCEGGEDALTDCRITWVPYEAGKAAIKHVDVGGVYCPPPTPPPECETVPPVVQECTTGQIRFDSSDPSSSEGLVQYCYNQQWTYFCSMDTPSATVACNQLGFQEYSWATIITDGSFGDGDKYTFIDSVTCTGSESKLSDCTLTMQPDCLPKCTSNVAIRCYKPIGCNEGEIRLADGGFSQRGRVEQCLNGVWGTVCDNGWDHTDAVILCKAMGFPGTDSVSYSGSKFGAGSGPAVYSEFNCGGWETSLLECDRKNYPDIYCSPDNIAGALCTSVCDDGDVRLVGGQNSHEGTVEICFNSIWGMVHDLNWGASDALVVCRQLNLGDDVGAIIGSHFGRPSDTVHLSNVGCFGDELTLGACGSTRLDIGDAQLYPTVAGVTCRAASFVFSPPSIPSMASTTSAGTIPSNQASSSDSTTGVTTTVIILGVVVLIAIVAAIVILVGIILMRIRTRDEPKQNRSGPREARTTMSQLEKDVVNPLAVEADLDGDDENTKTLQDLIHESQMK